MKQFLLILGLVFATQFSPAQSASAEKKPLTENSPVSGKVVETMNTAGYTYVLVDDGKQKVWVAAVQFDVKKGDTVLVKSGMPMPNYHSKTLNRDFDLVYFASNVEVNGKSQKAESAELPVGHPPITGTDSNLPKGHPPTSGEILNQKIGPIHKAAGGKTIQEIYAEKSKLKGKPVSVRGRIVKYNGGILGKNWLHIKDGSGKFGSDDLMVTTDSDAKLGDTVLVNGKVSINRDFGSGYKYDVMVEDAQVTIESSSK